ncbi:hypothetical protein AVEN_206652-1 [Araneus ventricosus]|uniref:Uncharacterized protein n=1 Tax=Araneus ventricosus TaxID=182803 RepID=A0A4Y2H7X0_ARAVE|nr:hypothetical protein AVEN_206652-1 [Araneus ventricosus]
MWFRRRVDSAVQTESHGEILEEIPEEELMNETGDSGVMPDSEAKTDEISDDHTESHGEILEEIPEEELMNEIGDSGDKPVSEAKTDEIRIQIKYASRKEILEAWQERWSSGSKARWTYSLLSRVDYKRMNGDFFLHQVYTGRYPLSSSSRFRQRSPMPV